MDPITSRLTLLYLRAAGHTRSARRSARNDRGQGTLEYVGIVLAVLALCGAVVMFLRTDLGEKLKDAIEGALDSIGVRGSEGGTGGSTGP